MSKHSHAPGHKKRAPMCTDESHPELPRAARAHSARDPPARRMTAAATSAVGAAAGGGGGGVATLPRQLATRPHTSSPRHDDVSDDEHPRRAGRWRRSTSLARGRPGYHSSRRRATPPPAVTRPSVTRAPDSDLAVSSVNGKSPPLQSTEQRRSPVILTTNSGRCRGRPER